jgi:hypothetical protein
MAILLSIPIYAQKQKTAKPKNEVERRVEESRVTLVNASKDYKRSLETVLSFDEQALKDANNLVELRKVFVAEGLVSKRELEDAERKLAATQVKVNETRTKIHETEELIAEASGEDQLAKLSARPGSYYTTAALIRYNGTSHWALTDIVKVQGFFTSKFKHSLPISAYGQSAVHDHLGFDHRNAVDVAVHPDSAEGQAIMTYLRSLGIPFIAFRYAVPGSATGAHIHVGYPSHRIGR